MEKARLHLSQRAFQSILENSWDTVVSVHAEARDIRNRRQSADYSDVHHSIDFLSHLESEREASEGTYSIQLSLAYDAFPVTKASKLVIESVEVRLQ